MHVRKGATALLKRRKDALERLDKRWGAKATKTKALKDRLALALKKRQISKEDLDQIHEEIELNKEPLYVVSERRRLTELINH